MITFWPPALLSLAEDVVRKLRQDRQILTTAESCTGGLLAGLITSVAGASEVFNRGYVTYSNQAKHEDLGVSITLLEEHGAVSAPVAAEMATGAVQRSQSGLALSITGIAGPGGGTDEKPIGLVYMGISCLQNGVPQTQTHQFHFAGSRHEVRMASLRAALELVINSTIS